MVAQNSKVASPSILTPLTSRHEAIVEEVNTQGFVSITALAQQFSVSDMSIRRDASTLEKQGLVRRVRGGLLRTEMNQEDGDFPSRDQVNTELKKRVAQVGATLVGDDDVLAVDAGTTGFQLVNALSPSFRGTIISHSLPVLSYLLEYPQINTIGLGGDLYTRSRAFVGSQAVQASRGLRAKTFFMGAAAVAADGIFASWDVEKEIKHALADISQRIVLLVDHTKFAASAPVFLMGWDPRISLVSDSVPEEVKKEVTAAGVELILTGQ